MENNNKILWSEFVLMLENKAKLKEIHIDRKFEKCTCGGILMHCDVIAAVNIKKKCY